MMDENPKLTHRAVVDFLICENAAAQEIHNRVQKVYYEACSSFATVKH